MKKIIFLSILILVCSVSFYSCKKNKDEEAVADFTYTYISNGGVQVTFTGKGNASWDFGGAGVQVGTGNIISYYYVSNGAHIIKLTSENLGSTKDKSEAILISGVPTQVKITSVKLKEFRDTTTTGNPWDSDLSGPDIQFVYYSISDGFEDITSVFPNLQHSQLPVSVNLTSSKTIGISTSFNIYCFDDDYLYNENIEQASLFVENITSKALCFPACSQVIYPSSYFSNNGRIEIKLEWLP